MEKGHTGHLGPVLAQPNPLGALSLTSAALHPAALG